MPDDQEERIKALEAEIAALRKPVTKAQPLYQTLPGQGSVPLDRAGNRVLPPAVPSQTTVGASGGFSGGGYRTDGAWAPDGISRNRKTGEVLSTTGPGSTGEGPHRSVQHQQAIDHLDRAFPVTRPAPTEE